MLTALCLVCGMGIVYLTRLVPSAVRLLDDAPADLTRTPSGRRWTLSVLPTAIPTATAIEVLSIPTPRDSDACFAYRRARSRGKLDTHTHLDCKPYTGTPHAHASCTHAIRMNAFESQHGRNNDYETMVAAPDGSRQINLTDSWADDFAPVWVPDGRRIAFVSFRPANDKFCAWSL